MSGGRYPRWVPGIELREDWLELTREEIIDPDREIVDPLIAEDSMAYAQENNIEERCN